MAEGRQGPGAACRGGGDLEGRLPPDAVTVGLSLDWACSHTSMAPTPSVLAGTILSGLGQLVNWTILLANSGAMLDNRSGC